MMRGKTNHFAHYDRKDRSLDENGLTLRTAMTEALAEAETAARLGEVPVGAVLLGPDGAPLARAGNRVEAGPDPTAHAEILVLRAGAERLRTPRLTGCTLVVTLEPCAMCAQAIALARLDRLVFGAYDPKGGGVEHGARVFERPTCHHRPEIIGGLRESDAGALLRAFFRARR
jgi:tRNA(Arg) A34 adenosine deaminase TadA